jgi:hypothetical protein
VTTVTGGYVRHRDRMIQESVFEDLSDTLIACRWMTGTTKRPVIDPYGLTAEPAIVTTTSGEVLKLAEGNPINLIDFFPEAEEDDADHKTQPNTFACDGGRQAAPGEPLELGSRALVVPYLFSMAFYAVSDGVAQAVLNDLRDRYQGFLVNGDYVPLYNYNAPSFDDDTPPVLNMDCVSFLYNQNSDASVAPWEPHLYFAELRLEDIQEG